MLRWPAWPARPASPRPWPLPHAGAPGRPRARAVRSAATSAARAGLTMQQVRQDRVLFEARQHSDPLHLMRLFGLGDGGAMPGRGRARA
ncbi:hypothetical protein AMK22_33290 [Streptomyces sp. CB01580]|nr:hypothetical protein AMK22_33290 [Streptomyces sp. CB01580]